MDLLYALLLILFGALTWGLVALCHHLERSAP